MATTYTPYYNLTKPGIGGEPDTWGDLLNDDFDKIDAGMHTAQVTADAAQTSSQTSSQITAHASGLPDEITASFTPPITELVDGQILLVRAAFINLTTTPTFTPNSGTITAATIVKGANFPLEVGDIGGASHWIGLQYDETLTKWVLLNPFIGVSTQAQAINGTDNHTIMTPLRVRDAITNNPEDYLKTSGGSMTGELISMTSAFGRHGAVTTKTEGNGLLWGHPNPEYTCMLGALNVSGAPTQAYHAYHSATQNTLKRSSASIYPAAWIYNSANGSLTYSTAPIGAVDSDITNFTQQLSIGTDGVTSFRVRPRFNGAIPYDTSNFNPDTKADTTTIFGLAQTYQNVTSSRTTNVTYTNTFEKVIVLRINIYFNASLFNFVIGGVTVDNGGLSSGEGDKYIQAEVPPGNSYGVFITSGSIVDISRWIELR